jgi:hypothetical protein
MRKLTTLEERMLARFEKEKEIKAPSYSATYWIEDKVLSDLLVIGVLVLEDGVYKLAKSGW